MSDTIDLKNHIRSIPDFPKPGILFYDISTLLAHPKAWHATIERLADRLRPYKPDVLAGIESRGFLLAAPLAAKLGARVALVERDRPGGDCLFTGCVPSKTLIKVAKVAWEMRHSLDDMVASAWQSWSAAAT